jgi:hypothetical protein
MSKQSGKPNALKHGANAKAVLLWGEKYEDYESLRAAFFKEYYPNGPSEEYLVEALFDLVWRRRRILRYEELQMQKHLTGVRKNNENSPHWANLSKLASAFEKLASAEEVEKQLALIDPLYCNTIRSKWPLAKDGDPKVWGDKIAKGLAAVKIPTVYEEGDEFIVVFESASIMLDAMSLERIDAQIETTLKRLVQTKTMKQALDRLHPKLITISHPNKPPEDNKSVEPSELKSCT